MFLAGDYVPLRNKVCMPSDQGDALLLANLEAPILDVNAIPQKQFKAGPCLYNVEESVSVDSRFKFVFSLANNHIMDYGTTGLTQTLDFLASHGIRCFGAGYSIEEARRAIIVSESGKRIGIIGCRESQFGSLNCADMGWWIFDAIDSLRQCVDYIIISSHAAAEDSPFPSPALRDYYHRLIDSGADVIHGHHSHVPQGWEDYSDGVIFYGLGNFVVDPICWTKDIHRWSLVASLDFSGHKLRYSMQECTCEKDGDGVVRVVFGRKNDGKINKDRYLSVCAKALSSDSNVCGYWQEMAIRLYEETYGIPHRMPAVNDAKMSFVDRVSYARDAVVMALQSLRGSKKPSARSRSIAAMHYNSYQCLSHVEMIKAALGIALENERDFRTSEIKDDCDAILRCAD